MVLFAGNDLFAYLLPRYEAFAVEVTQFETCLQQSEQALVYLFFCDFPLSHSIGQTTVCTTTFHIRSCNDSRCHSVFLRFGSTMIRWIKEVVDCPAVARHQSLESPFLAQDVVEQTRVSATRFTVETVVGTHNLLHISFLHQCLEGRQVGLPQITFWEQFEVEAVTVVFRTAMYSKVLGTCQEFSVLSFTSIFNVSVTLCTLQTTYYGQSHLGGQVGVFTVGLLSASPAGITEDVDVGCPERQALILSDASILSCDVVLGSCFIAGSQECLFHQSVIPCGS